MPDLNIEAALRRALYLAVDGRDFTLARIYLDCLGRRADHIEALTAGENAAECSATDSAIVHHWPGTGAFIASCCVEDPEFSTYTSSVTCPDCLLEARALAEAFTGEPEQPKCPDHGQPMVADLTDLDTGEQLWHCACTYGPPDPALKVWKEALAGADTQIQQAVTESAAEPDWCGSPVTHGPHAACGGFGPPRPTGFITLVGEHPCANGRCPDPEAHAEGAHDQ